MNTESLSTTDLQAFLEQSGMTVGQLAKRAGVDPSGLGKVSRGTRTAGASMASKVNAVTAAAPEVEAPVAATDKAERLRLAKEEHKALKAWIADGSKPPKPATPNIDAIEADGPTANRPKARKASSSTRSAKPTAPVRFFHDGKPMPDSQNKLSSMAWFFTKGCDAKNPAARLGTPALKALIEKAGGDPSSTSWTVELPNGVTLESRPEAAAAQQKAS